MHKKCIKMSYKKILKKLFYFEIFEQTNLFGYYF